MLCHLAARRLQCSKKNITLLKKSSNSKQNLLENNVEVFLILLKKSNINNSRLPNPLFLYESGSGGVCFIPNYQFLGNLNLGSHRVNMTKSRLQSRFVHLQRPKLNSAQKCTCGKMTRSRPNSTFFFAPLLYWQFDLISVTDDFITCPQIRPKRGKGSLVCGPSARNSRKQKLSITWAGWLGLFSALLVASFVLF